MKKLIITLLIIVAIAGLCACNKTEPKQDKLEPEIAQKVLEDLETIGDYTMELISVEDVPWAGWDCWNYLFEINGKTYLVGVLRDEYDWHYVDVDCELTAEEVEQLRNKIK